MKIALIIYTLVKRNLKKYFFEKKDTMSSFLNAQRQIIKIALNI